ncbi:MAG: hypothetical protein R3B47_07770 [Bacteroidia bacterium]
MENCSLEVIDQNKRAISVYERIGFRLHHRLLCYTGTINFNENVRIQEVGLEAVKHYSSNHTYSWDNRLETIEQAGKTYQSYLAFRGENAEPAGYFILNPDIGYVAQLESTEGDWSALFSGISQVCPTIKINNIHEGRSTLIQHLEMAGFEHTINQFEMGMRL